MTKQNYTVKHMSFDDLFATEEIYDFARKLAREINELYCEPFSKFDVQKYCERHRFMVCFRDEEPVGVCLYHIGTSVFDDSTKILTQDLIYSKPGSRAAKLLFDEMIDFGRRNANHIVNMLTPHTNISPKSLEKRGFKKIEDIFKLEV